MDLQDELAEIVAQQRHLITRLEALAVQLRSDVAVPVFDPWDEPPVAPSVDGDRTQRDWCALMLWAGLFGVNARGNRGATKAEVVQIAKTAGYVDGRGWNKWNGWEERTDGRWVTAAGAQHLLNYYRAVGRKLPDDLATAAAALAPSEA